MATTRQRFTFNTAPAALIGGQPDYGAGFRQGLGGIADVLLKNRDYAAGLAKQREDAALAREGLAVRGEELAADRDYKNQSIEAELAKAGLTKDAQGNIVPAGANSGIGSVYRKGLPLEVQDRNIILDGDPSTPEYGMSFLRVFGPKDQQVVQPDNTVKLITVYPPVPPNIRWPTGMSPETLKAGDPNAPAAGGAAAAAGGRTVGGKPPTESEAAGRVLLASAEPNYKVAKAKFDALGGLFDQAAALGGDTGNVIQSADYQVARNAVSSLIQAEGYARSGATMNPDEVAKRLATVMPAIGDKPATLALKKVELDNMIAGVRAKGYPAGGAPGEAPPAPDAPLPPTYRGQPVNEATIASTMAATGMTREQVIAKIRAGGGQ